MEVPRVSRILESAGLIDLSSVPVDLLERAKIFGSATHKMTELWDKGTLLLTSISKPLFPYLKGWQQFLNDYNITINPEEIEKRFESKKWKFRGRPDRWPIINSIRTLLDIKTSTQMYAATEIQTAFYEILLNEHGFKIKRRWGVQLLGEVPKGTKPYNIEVYNDPGDKAVAMHCLGLHYYKLRRGLIK